MTNRFIDPVFGASQDVPAASEPTPAPRWTLAPGRTLCYDGKEIAVLCRLPTGTKGDPMTCSPSEADDLAHLIVLLLQEGAGGILADTPYPFPLSGAVADEARAVTPTTLPTA